MSGRSGFLLLQHQQFLQYIFKCVLIKEIKCEIFIMPFKVIFQRSWNICAWYASYLGQLGRDQSETQAGSLAGLTSGLVPSSSAEHGNCLHTLTSCRTVGAPWQVLHGQLWRSRQCGWGGVSPSELQSPDLGHNRRVAKLNDSNVTADHTWCGHLIRM